MAYSLHYESLGGTPDFHLLVLRVKVNQFMTSNSGCGQQIASALETKFNILVVLPLNTRNGR